jgi:hypothetical protein
MYRIRRLWTTLDDSTAPAGPSMQETSTYVAISDYFKGKNLLAKKPASLGHGKKMMDDKA